MIITTAQGDELVRVDGNRLEILDDEIILASCVRNEAVRLPHFVDYHRRLGVSRFFFVDNGSSDGSTAFLLSQPEVHVFHTDGSYAGSHYGVHWINALLARFAASHWTLVLDADELLVYPDCEDRPLPEFVELLEGKGADALLTFLLDMYADGPIRASHHRAEASFLETCPFFDSDSYTLGTGGLHSRVPARGGARRRLFWEGCGEQRGKPPVLSKVPLVRWSPTREYLASTHLIEGVSLAPITGVLLHFKLFSDFVDRSALEVGRGEHWDGAAQYEAYARRLAREPALNPMYAGSVRYQDSRQLIGLGLMVAERHSESSTPEGTGGGPDSENVI